MMMMMMISANRMTLAKMDLMMLLSMLMLMLMMMLLGDPLYCLPQDCLLVGNPEVGNSECINHQDCLP